MYQTPNSAEEDRDKREFDDQRADREQQEAQEEVDALDPALDDAAQAAGLARDVMAHRERMHVAKVSKASAQRALRDPHKDRIAQFAKADRAQVAPDRKPPSAQPRQRR